jgi:hypothetical protein
MAGNPARRQGRQLRSPPNPSPPARLLAAQPSTVPIPRIFSTGLLQCWCSRSDIVLRRSCTSPRRIAKVQTHITALDSLRRRASAAHPRRQNTPPRHPGSMRWRTSRPAPCAGRPTQSTACSYPGLPRHHNPLTCLLWPGPRQQPDEKDLIRALSRRPSRTSRATCAGALDMLILAAR